MNIFGGNPKYGITFNVLEIVTLILMRKMFMIDTLCLIMGACFYSHSLLSTLFHDHSWMIISIGFTQILGHLLNNPYQKL